jgi:hypothetical protein
VTPAAPPSGPARPLPGTGRTPQRTRGAGRRSRRSTSRGPPAYGRGRPGPGTTVPSPGCRTRVSPYPVCRYSPGDTSCAARKARLKWAAAVNPQREATCGSRLRAEKSSARGVLISIGATVRVTHSCRKANRSLRGTVSVRNTDSVSNCSSPVSWAPAGLSSAREDAPSAGGRAGRRRLRRSQSRRSEPVPSRGGPGLPPSASPDRSRRHRRGPSGRPPPDRRHGPSTSSVEDSSRWGSGVRTEGRVGRSGPALSMLRPGCVHSGRCFCGGPRAEFWPGKRGRGFRGDT